MFPTLIIGLREGLEASLIVGIVAAFLRRSGRPNVMRAMALGVTLAVALCIGVAVLLRIAEQDLPARKQEGLETIIGLLATATITYMIVWMKRNARGLKKELEQKTSDALENGTTRTLVGMAFLAVLREGFETAVFLLAAFQASTNRGATASGAVIGIAISVAIGYGIYRGGVKLNLSKFFRITGFVLVLVAAGLLSTAVHTAHEAGWFNSLQSSSFDLRWLVKPGSLRASLITGTFGMQPQPTIGEVIAWVAFTVPMSIFVLSNRTFQGKVKQISTRQKAELHTA